MARKRSRVLDYCVFILVRAVVAIVAALPLETTWSVARFVGWLVCRLDRRHREVARDNLCRAFPGRYTPTELDELVCATFQHFVTAMAEMIHMPRRLHRHAPESTLAGGHCDAAAALFRSKRPVLIVTAHFGNWEFAGHAFSMLGFPTHVIARPIDNPYLDTFLRSYRERNGQEVLAKSGEFERIRDILLAGGNLATLVDQDAGRHGQFVDFFGRPASTVKAVALLALQYKAPLVVIGFPRVGAPMSCVGLVGDVIYPEEYRGRRAESVRLITQRYTSALERMIAAYPEQYFWLHRRWKSQPAPSESAKAA